MSHPPLFTPPPPPLARADWATHIGYVAEQRLAKFGEVGSFEDLAAHRAAGTVAPLLRTIEGWLRTEREGKRARGVKLTEDAERATDELRGATGNGYLSGRFNGGFNG